MSLTQFYALGPDKSLHFDVRLRSGAEYSVPYPLLPVFILKGDELKILAYELEVVVKGRNMKTIRDHLKEERLLWMKESANGKDYEKTNVFIASIKLKGGMVGKEKIN